MGNRIPGPICSSRLGPAWIDLGTTCRSKTSSPGPVGLRPSSQGVTGRRRALPRPRRCDGPGTIKEGIRVLRKESPFAEHDYGREILDLLAAYEKREKNYRDGISYGNTTGARGYWYGTGITIREDFCGNIEGTILELIHEASHAHYDQIHPLLEHSMESIIQNETDSEYYSVINQIDVYLWLKERNPQYADADMERRIKLNEMGLLRKMLEGIIRSDRAPHSRKPEPTPVGTPQHKETQKRRPRPHVIYVEPPR
jgi:hypothetical protein